MAFFESLRKESLDRRQEAAFSKLSDTLVFESPRGFKLSRKNVPEFSHELEAAFLEQDAAHQKEAKEYTHRVIRESLEAVKSFGVQAGVADDSEDVAPEVPALDKEKAPRNLLLHRETPTQTFLDTTNAYLAQQGVDDSFRYGSWGFTPKIAGMRTQENGFEFGKDGKNCFGFVMALGGIFSKLGLQFEMGITVDHPFAIVEVEGKKYLASLAGVHEAKGTFEERDGYTMYKPSAEDGIPYQRMLVWNFDEAAVYELLENFEVLRQMSLGNKVNNLPNSYESGIKLAEENKEVLQATSWREVQAKISPGLSAHFRKHAAEWEEEIDRIAVKREMNDFFKDVMQAAQASTSLRNLSFDDFKKEFLPIAKENGKAIVDLILSDIPCGSETPLDVVRFAQKAKERLSAISGSEAQDVLRVELTKQFLLPFMPKEALTRE